MHEIPAATTVIDMHLCRANQAGDFQLKNFGTKTIQILNQLLEMGLIDALHFC